MCLLCFNSILGNIYDKNCVALDLVFLCGNLSKCGQKTILDKITQKIFIPLNIGIKIIFSRQTILLKYMQ